MTCQGTSVRNTLSGYQRYTKRGFFVLLYEFRDPGSSMWAFIVVTYLSELISERNKNKATHAQFGIMREREKIKMKIY